MNKDNYIIKIKQASNLSSEQKIEYLNRLENVQDGFPILLTKYHLSSFFGIKWYPFKKILNNIDCNYTTFKISKKRGGVRNIESPKHNLKQIQHKILHQILYKVKISDESFGFVKHKSIIDNANHHLCSNYMLGIDLEDYFTNIKTPRVYYIFRYICGYCHEVSYTLTLLVTKNQSLPQGAPTSPFISNIVAYKLDYRLSRFAEKLNFRYTRYADDISISSQTEIPSNVKYTVYKIIEDEGFKVNKLKTKSMSRINHLEVTGIYIYDDSIHVPRKYIKGIEQQLYYIKRYGIVDHKNKANIRNNFYIEHIQGCINYINQIDQSHGSKLQSIFNEIFS